MASSILSGLKVLLPRRSNPKGITSTETFNPSNTNNILPLPAYRDHLTDIFTERTSLDSRALLKQLFITDPDMSSAVHAFLTVADTQPLFLVKDVNGQIDPSGQQLLQQLLVFFTTRTDYTKGFSIVPSLGSLTEAMRYMILLRGAIGAELVVSKEFLPSQIRQVDMGRIEWYEVESNHFIPQQRTLTGELISLDIPTFFCTWFRKDPTAIYTYSPFVSAINTIAARQQVINDLYRIMRLTGYPRMEVTVMEEVLIKNAPPEYQMDKEKRNQYINAQLTVIKGAIAGIRPDQAFVHTDSIKPGMLNEKSPGMAIDISAVIDALNAQNQAGLRTMATILGRGESGVNTATVEARIFSMSAQAINEPVADILSQMLTMALRLQGSQSYVECSFAPVELRSALELETNLLVKSQRLRADLSDGIITDEEYHLEMYRRLPPPGSAQLSGTKFLSTAGQSATVDSTNISPNADPLGRSIASPKAQKPARDTKAGKQQIKSGG